jgi:hypothetical protein
MLLVRDRHDTCVRRAPARLAAVPRHPCVLWRPASQPAPPVISPAGLTAYLSSIRPSPFTGSAKCLQKRPWPHGRIFLLFSIGRLKTNEASLVSNVPAAKLQKNASREGDKGRPRNTATRGGEERARRNDWGGNLVPAPTRIGEKGGPAFRPGLSRNLMEIDRRRTAAAETTLCLLDWTLSTRLRRTGEKRKRRATNARNHFISTSASG